MIAIQKIAILSALIYSSLHGYEIEDPPGDRHFGIIYVKRIHSARVFCNYKLLQYNIEIERFTNLRVELSNFVELLREICASTRFSTICTHVTDEIDLFASELERKYRLIESANVESLHSYRKKRNTDAVIDILKKSISITDIGYSDLRQSIEEIRIFISNIEKGQNKNLHYVDYINFNSLAQLALTTIKRHVKYYDLILDVHINSNYKALIDLISIDLVRNELKNLKTKMKAEPCDLVYGVKLIDVVNTLKTSSMKTKIIRNNLSVSFKIPTFFSESYDLVQAIPIPYEQKNATYISQVRIPYYLIRVENSTNETYSFPMTEEEKMNCKHTPGYLLCYPNRYVQITKALEQEPDNFFLPDVQPCRTGKEINSQPISYACHPVETIHTNQVIQLTRTTYYVYITKPTRVRLSCDKTGENILFIKPQVIYHLEDDCSITMDDGNLPKRKNGHMPSLFQNFHVFPIYSVEDKELIGKEPMRLDQESRMRNVQPDFTHIQEQLAQIPRTQIVQKIIDHPELIAISFSLIMIFLMITWATMIYLWQSNRNKLENLESKIPIKSEKITPILPELKCQFNFNDAYLPPKQKKVKFPSSTYDVPKTPARKALLNERFEIEDLDEIVTFDSIVTSCPNILNLNNTPQSIVTEIEPRDLLPTVQYATIIKNQQL